jgi:hypothetical protein
LTIKPVDEDDNPFVGLVVDDFDISGFSNATIVSGLNEVSNGIYQLSIANTVSELVELTIVVKDVELTKKTKNTFWGYFNRHTA